MLADLFCFPNFCLEQQLEKLTIDRPPRHPSFDPLPNPRPPPPHQIHHHHARVEIARIPPGKRPGIPLIRPEPAREVLGEVRVAVFWRTDSPQPKAGVPELVDVVEDDEVGVEVDHSPDARLKAVGEVVPRVIQRLF
ncbi:hypothetical protein AAC387_Pa07g0468 [Persea americana]